MTLCERCRTAVSAMLDGEQLPHDVLVVDNHLAGCAECRRAAEAFRRLTELARRTAVSQDGPPPCSTPLRHLRRVGNAACGCGPDCACGCQRGETCGCRYAAA